MHDESILRLEPLAGTIVGEDVTHKVYGTKVGCFSRSHVGMSTDMRSGMPT